MPFLSIIKRLTMKLINNKFLHTLLLLSIVFFAASCGDDDEGENPTPSNPDGTGSVMLHFDNKFDPMGGVDFALETKFAAASGDTITANQLRYWISNIQLLNGSDVVYSDEDSYYLMEKTSDNEREMIALSGIPEGTYTGLKFSIGVDSVANSSLDNQAGELDHTDGMAWNWNTGYKFFRMDGTYYSSASSSYEDYQIHTGLDNYYVEKEMTLPNPLSVESDGSHMIHFMVNVGNVLNSPNQLSIGSRTIDDGSWQFFSPNTAFDQLNENISGIFMIHHVE